MSLFIIYSGFLGNITEGIDDDYCMLLFHSTVQLPNFQILPIIRVAAISEEMNVNTSLLFGAVALGELLSWVTVS
jgi:hypothetical protein